MRLETCQFVFAPGPGAGRPGHQFELRESVVYRLLLDVLLGTDCKHPCYQLHSAHDGGTSKKHVHIVYSTDSPASREQTVSSFNRECIGGVKNVRPIPFLLLCITFYRPKSFLT